MSKEELFEIICKFRIGSYPLQDRNIIADEWIVGIEENILSAHGYEYEDYQEWREEN
tara:strand:+ start:56 stop:226 length:171 start_codon:yes stop_codon:yes gene_type:complete